MERKFEKKTKGENEMNTRSLYENELKDEFEQIKDIDIVSDEHHKVVVDISQLTDRLVKLKEVENEKKKIENDREKIEIEREKIEIDRARIDAEKDKANTEARKIKIEEQKVKIEEHKVKIEEQKLDEDRKNRLIKMVIDGLSIAVPAGITITGMVLMFLFEEKGTITGKVSNKIVDRIFRFGRN